MNLEWLEIWLGGAESYLAQGGVIMGLLVLASVVGVAIILEKLIRLRSKNLYDPDRARTLLLAIKNRDRDQIQLANSRAPQPMKDMVEAARSVRDLPKEDMLSEMSAVASGHVRRLGKRLKMLGILASIAPLLGLLGTVLGMIQAMDEVALGAGADPLVVGQGISQALMTTAVGLAVGIPLLFMHSLLKDRVNKFASRLEEFGHELMKAIHHPDTVRFGGTGGQQDSGSRNQVDEEPEPAVS